MFQVRIRIRKVTLSNLIETDLGSLCCHSVCLYFSQELVDINKCKCEIIIEHQD